MRETAFKAAVLGQPRRGWGGRVEEGSGWGTHVHLWQKISKKKEKEKERKTS